MMHGLLRTGQVSRSFTSAATLHHCGWVLLLLLCVVCTSVWAHGNEGLVLGRLGMDLFNCRMSTLDDRRATDESGWGQGGGMALAQLWSNLSKGRMCSLLRLATGQRTEDKTVAHAEIAFD